MRWLILADDLTGAADCAVAFARRGTESVVTWGDSGGIVTAPVVSVDAESREQPATVAIGRQLAAQVAHWRPGVRLYKKIDSTLRGQPAAELAVQLQALASGGGRAPLAVVAPAFPATGRLTLGGRVVVNGKSAEATPLWTRDHAYASASVPEMLASAGLRAETILLDQIQEGPNAVLARMADAARRGAAAVVCDCTSERDLEVIAMASLRLSAAAWVGSAGLAHALAAMEGAPGPFHPALPARSGCVLTVVGSPAELSRLQSQTVRARGLAQYVPVDRTVLLAGPEAAGWRATQTSLAEQLTAGRDVLLEIAASPHPDHVRRPELVARLAAVVAPLSQCIGALVATGGDTARALLSAFGVRGIRLTEEIEPGVPLGETVGALTVPVVTKAGAFGDAETLCRCLARLGR